MTGQLEFSGGGKSYLKNLSLRAALNVGCSGQAVLEEHWEGAARGAAGIIVIGNQRFDVVVQDFNTPWSHQQRQQISFCDPVTFAKPFASETFFSEVGVSYADLVASRELKVSAPKEFSETHWSQIAVDSLRMSEVLRQICAEREWHWSWHNGQLELAPLSADEAIELNDISNGANCDGGFSVDVHLAIPKLGQRVKVRTHVVQGSATFREGYVAGIEIELPTRHLAARLTILESLRPPSPVVSTGSSWRTASVQSLSPLQVQVEGEAKLQVRGQLMGLKIKDCQVAIPLKDQDHVVLEWPRRAMTTGPLRVQPEGEVDISVDAIEVRATKIKAIVSEVDIDEPA